MKPEDDPTTMKRSIPSIALLACLVLSAGLITACGGASQAPAAAPSSAPASAAAAASAPRPPASAPPVSVTTVPAREQDLTLSLQAIGSASPVSSVDVKAQVTGVITQVLVKEGQPVKKGDTLFVLDSRADEANVAKARAQIARDEAALADAKRQLTRSRELLAQNFISQGAVDTNQTLVDTQAAILEGDKAALEAARVSLSYAKVVAAGPGRAGTVAVFPGSAVQANVTVLVTLTQLDPIDVSFNLPQRYLGDVLKALKNQDAKVKARLPESPNEVVGKLTFVDSVVDPATGTIKVKARFDNKGNRLWPGAFASVSMEANTIKDAIVIPLGAIVQTARGSIVFIAEKGRAAVRPVKVLAAQGELAAVSGVKVGDKVVLDGRQNLRPETPLVERPRDAASRPAGAASAAGKASEPAAAGSAAPSTTGAPASRPASS